MESDRTLVNSEKLKLLYNQEEIEYAIDDIFSKLSPRNLCFVIVLKGGAYLGFELLRRTDWNIPYGFIGCESYRIGTHRGALKITYPLDLEPEMVEGKNIWVIDDILDSGHTLVEVSLILERMNPASIRNAVLVRRDIENQVGSSDVCGFVYEGNKFLVGCGLGLGEEYRNLHNIYEYIGNDI